MDIEKAADQQHLFPLAGLCVGLFAALAAAILGSQMGHDLDLVKGGLVVALLYLMNGMMHIEGLADFADGVMTNGSHSRKRETMKDPRCGVGGVFATAIYLLLLYASVTTVCAKASEDVTNILPWTMTAVVGIVLAEMSAKLSMVMAMYLGPSSHEGMGSVFVAKSNLPKLAGAIAIAIAAGVFMSGLYAPIVLIGLVTGAMTTMKARKELGGVSGDVFGAANEIARVVTLITWVLIV